MRAYLQLVRLPTVFTAMADIVLGFLLTHRAFEPAPKFFALLAASCGLYLSGMVFNDVFDRKQDAVERPHRPIPSGRVPLWAAVLLGTLLMAGGVAAAWTVSAPSRVISVALVVAILGYDSVLKRTPVGPLAMGTCRFLNVLLGASDYRWLLQMWARPHNVCAIALGVYIVGVTWFARTEARQSSRRQLTGALLVLDAAFGLLAWLLSTWPNVGDWKIALFLLGVVAASLNLRALSAIQHPTPASVQGMIKLFLLNYVMICAALVYWHTGAGVYAFATACLVVPALLLSRVIAMT